MPIYQTTSYVFDSTEHGARLFNLEEPGNIYTRIGNPTVAVLEERVAALEGGVAAVATASGQAAIALALLTLLRSGERLVAGTNLYGGTHTLFSQSFRRLGIFADFADSGDPEAFRRALRPETRAIYVEALGNPKLDVPDFEALAAVAREAGVPLIVDNTLASPWLCQPLAHGADLVVHSATKFLGGHGTTLGGVVVDGGRFDWRNGNFPEFTNPNPSYHGAVLTDVAGAGAFAAKARLEGAARTSARPSRRSTPSSCSWASRPCPCAWSATGKRPGSGPVAGVAPQGGVGELPGPPEPPQPRLARRYFRKARASAASSPSGSRPGWRAGARSSTGVQLFSRLANVGDAKSLIIHPASTTHQQLSAGKREPPGSPTTSSACPWAWNIRTT